MIFYSYYLLLLSFWEFLCGFVDCEYPTISEAKGTTIMKMIKKNKQKTPPNLKNCSNSLQNAELNAAQRLRKQHLHNICNLLQNISFAVIIPFLKIKNKCFYDLEKKTPSFILK